MPKRDSAARDEKGKREKPATAPRPEAGRRCRYVVGIGASAGGLDPLEQFFDHMPADSGLAFVIIQHLSPDFKSVMDELLARHTRMPLVRVEDGMSLAPNSIYLIPPKKNMVLSEDGLRLIDQDLSRRHSPNFPIDMFFQSLACNMRERAVGVVLSGTGSDGTRGVRAIHEAGGVVFVQTPDSAQFDGMPRSAIGTGLADFVLAPKELARSIYDYARRPSEALAPTAPDGKDDALDQITTILAREQEIDFSHYKPTTLRRRIERRRVISGCNTLDDYISVLKESADERVALRNDLLICVTSFFRDPKAWAQLQRSVINRLVAGEHAGDELRFWVTACSTGEEAYSLAMLVQEALDTSRKQMEVKIFATDIDGTALEQAAAGFYPESIAGDVTEDRLRRFFKKKTGGYQVARQLREMMIFASHNLTRDPPFTRMHLVSCRNLLIYLQPKLQRAVLTMLHFALRTEGTLFLGAAETLGDLEQEFGVVQRKWKIFKKKRDVRLPVGREFLPRAVPPELRAGPVGLRFPPKPDVMAGEVFGVYLRDRDAVCIVADTECKLVQVFGDSRLFLHVPEGEAPHNVTQMLPKPLALALNTALHRARKERGTVAYSGVKIEEPSRTRYVNLRVSYHVVSKAAPEMFVILLENAATTESASAVQFDVDSQASQRIADLEQELQQSKENLQATIEELETTNEEQQATNQELLASNEELQSTNEELRSVNEELYSVNAEYQSKIQELTRLNNDMDNLLESTQIGTVFLDKELRIREFTPAVRAVINLMEHDVGRPIDHIAYAIDLEHEVLLRRVEQVLRTGQAYECEVRSRNGASLLLRINPYRDERGWTQGVVLTFVAIAELKRTEQALRLSEQRLRRVLEAATSAMVMVNGDGEIVLVNNQMESFFGYTRDELIGQSIDLLVPTRFRAKHSEDRAGFLANPQSRPMGGGRDLYGVRKDGTTFPVEIGLSPLDTEEGMMVLATVVDISQRKEHERALARLAAIVQSSHDAILAKTLEGTITSWNAAAERMYGYTAEEAVGQSIALLVPPDRPDELDGLLVRLAQGETIKAFETVRQTKQGQRIDVSLTISPLYDKRGRVVGASTIARDITERKRAEIRLQLLQSVTEAISTSTDFESAMERATSIICETIGWDYGEAWVPDGDEGALRQCPRPYLGSRHLEKFARISQELSLSANRGLPGRVWSSGQPEWVLDMSNKSDRLYPRSKAAAEARLKAGFGVPIIANGQLSAVLVFFMESEPREVDLHLVIDLVQSVASQLGSVVQRKQIDAQLQIANAELEQTNREMEEFVYMVSHDLKSPLVSIGGILGMIKEELLEGRLVDAGELIATAEETVANMRDSIEDFLELSRIGQATVEFEAVQLGELVRDVIEKHAPQIDEKRLAVELSDELPTIQGDRDRLREVFDNLIVNALKYACDGSEPRLVIGTEQSDGELRVFVQDNGPGIEEPFQEKVFGLFERLSRSGKPGTGVGLAIVKRLMQMHGGRVWIESPAGSGTTFWLAFPSSVAVRAAH